MEGENTLKQKRVAKFLLFLLGLLRLGQWKGPQEQLCSHWKPQNLKKKAFVFRLVVITG